MNLTTAQNMLPSSHLEPYSMSVKDAARHFGYTDQGMYDMIYKGQLVFGKHFLKAGKKILIIVEPFKQYLYERSGLTYGES